MLTFETLVQTTQRTLLPVVLVLLYIDLLLVYCAVALQWLHSTASSIVSVYDDEC
jgi:hypothetical protein